MHALLPPRPGRRARRCAGMHASISAHIAREYLLDEAAGRWGANLPLFAERLGNEGRKAHVENLYFTYLFVLRAVRKAGPLLERAAFETGVPEADARTQALVAQLVRRRARPRCPGAGLPAGLRLCDIAALCCCWTQAGRRGCAGSANAVLRAPRNFGAAGVQLCAEGSQDGCCGPACEHAGLLRGLPASRMELYQAATLSCHGTFADRGRGRRRQVNSEALQQACPVPFDEGRMWKGADSAELKAQLQLHFQNITKVMDCVGCEKCKLWGKLQMLGAPCSLSTLTRAVCLQAGSMMGLSHARCMLVRHCQSQPSRAASARPHHATRCTACCPLAVCPLLLQLCVARCAQLKHPSPCGTGIATSLKVLFSADDCSGNPANGPQLVLERNEVIALLNLLERLSNSIEARTASYHASGVRC